MKCSHCGVENPSGMRFCGGCGRPLEAAAPARAESREAPQRRHMTVMFCDLVDSTPLAEALDAEDFRELLTDYRQACTRAVEQFGGYTAVYAGDGMTVYFGYPRAHEDDAQRAVHTGLAILDEIAALNARLHEQHDLSVQVRIGVHSGVVIAEELGGGAAETPSQLDVSGEMPHIASRIESVAPHGSVAISDDTRALIEGYFDTEPLGAQTLKGVSRPIGVHRILGPTGALGRLEVAAARRLTPAIGRQDELAELRRRWDLAATGHGTVVHVTGEAGIGKSRLVHELVETVADEVREVQRWQCSAHQQSTTLHPVITYLERTLDLSASQALHPLLADLLGVGSGDAIIQTLAPRDARTALLHVLESLLVRNSARQPLLLVVEDLHWADPTTVELLGRVVRSLPAIPVLCVLTFRSGFEPPWAPGAEIGLGPLTAAEVRELATAASDKELDSTTLEWVESAADGVPLFVEEMLKLGRAPDASAVPPTLEGLLTERLDRLPELADVIDMAAILGREFERSLLGALTDRETDLEQLTAADVLRLIDGGRCEFAHGLLQEAAYARILRRRRRMLHASVAGTLVTKFPDTAEREPELVARHWSAAEEPAKALPFWRAAGTRALERAAYLEAAAHYRHGLEALEAAGSAGDDLQQVDFLTHIGASMQAGYGYAAAGVDEAYAQARSACERACDDDRLVAVIRGEWMFHLLRGEYATALELADEMLSFGERGVRSPLAEGHLYRGLVHMYLGNFDLAREHLDQAVTNYEQPARADHIYEAQGDTGVGALAYLALVLWNLGYADEAAARSDLSLERAEHVGGPVTRAQAWGMRSILHLSRAERVELVEWVHRTHVHSVDNDLGYWRAMSSLLTGWLQGRMGDLDRGSARFQESLDAYIRSGSRLGLPHFHILFADLHRIAGDKQGGLDLLRAGEEYIEETGERFSESELFRFKGRLLMSGDEPDPEAATESLERAVAAARQQNARLPELQAALRLADHQISLGANCTVLDRLGELADWFGPASSIPDVERARGLVTSGTMAR